MINHEDKIYTTYYYSALTEIIINYFFVSRKDTSNINKLQLPKIICYWELKLRPMEELNSITETNKIDWKNLVIQIDNENFIQISKVFPTTDTHIVQCKGDYSPIC